jgi:hypothetical protein
MPSGTTTVEEASVDNECKLSWKPKLTCVPGSTCKDGICVCPTQPLDRCTGNLLKTVKINGQTCEQTWILKQTCPAGHCEVIEGQDAKCSVCTPGDIPNSETCDDTTVPGLAIISIGTITDAQCNTGSKVIKVCGGMPFVKGVCGTDQKSCTEKLLQEAELPEE